MNPRRFVAAIVFALSASVGAEPLAAVPSEAQREAWVRLSYPAFVSEALPEQFVFGFVVTPDFKVISHSALVRPGLRPISEDIHAMFPSIPMATAESQGIASHRIGSVERYGVIWVVLSSAQ